jgi:hypothetical protein
MSALDPIRARLAEVRGARADARARLDQAITARADAPGDGEEADRTIARLREEFDGLRARERADADLDPRQWINALNAGFPILLLPLRVQTRFLRTERGLELLVRVYPDDISVQSHQPTLSEGERLAGDAYWTAVAAVPGSKTTPPEDVWRGMVKRYGMERATWIMGATDPATGAVAPPTTQLRVPAVWTLPERLAFRCYGAADHLIAEVLGNPIPDGLEMGTDSTRPQAGFARDGATRELEYPPELAWQVDLQKAIDVGMAVRIPLDEQSAPGGRVDRLVVLGVRLSTDHQRSADLLAELIADHRYTDGFSLVPQGTPTNVTHDGDMAPELDADGTLKWIRGGGAYANEDPTKTIFENECDGLRLAHALGVDPDALRYVKHADHSDGSEAIAMKRALWSGTLGYYAQQMLWPLFEHANGERLTQATRFYFTHFVFGRGPLPAIRVGAQPYGVLPIVGDTLLPLGGRFPEWGESFIDQFTAALHGKLVVLSRVWLDLVRTLPRAGAGNAPDTRLVDVLSQQASSVEYRSERLIGKEYLNSYVDFRNATVSFSTYAQMLDERFRRFANRFPGLLGEQPFIFDLSFFGAVWTSIVENVNNLDRRGAPLLNGDVIDNLPFAEARGIDDAYPNYIKLIATADFAEVRRGLTRTQNEKTVPVTALLYILLRHSYLYEHAFGAMRLYHHFQGRPWRSFREKELYNAAFAIDPTYWDILEADPPPTWRALGLVETPMTALQLLVRRRELRDRVADWDTYFGDIDDFYRALDRLQSLPTARLERLFAEHVDLCGYRLDAWLTGLAYQRLIAARVVNERGSALNVGRRDGAPLRYDLNRRPLEYSRGLYLGAFGWVEDLHPDEAGTPVGDLPPELTPKNGNPVTRDRDNYGLIQAPSVNHAATAAVLRAASVSEPNITAFNIDLSSRRVREALWLIDGVRNGQTPAALLGYQFERAMREHDVVLLQHLPALRAVFPMPTVPDADGGPAESIPAKNVVNGLRVIQAARDGALDALLLPFMPDGTHRAVVAGIAGGLLDTLDAASDLMLAESVHQAAQGNYDRAGGVVTAAGEFTHVPDSFAVVETPRSGTALTHRIVVALNTTAAPDADATPRARLEPDLDAALRQLLGDPSRVSCSLVYLFRKTDGAAGETARYGARLDALRLAAIDLLYVLDDTARAELGARLALLTGGRFRADHPGAIVDAIAVDVETAGATGTRPLAAVLPLVTRLRRLLTSARPATARDFVPPNTLHGKSPRDINLFGVDTTELAARVNDLLTSFKAAMTALDSVPTSTASAARGIMLDAAAFGLAEAVPVEATLAPLVERAKMVKSLMEARVDACSTKWPVAPALPTDNDPIATLRDVAGILLGAAFPLMPRIDPIPDLAGARPVANPSPDRLDDWLMLASTVRSNAARLHHARIVAEVTTSRLPDLQVYQWPANASKWFAEKQSFDPTVHRDYLSIVVQSNGGLDATEPIGGLVVDEWHEVVPNQRETTAVAFHYDAPNAEPPQTLLLASSARELRVNGNWHWEELVSCVNQALLLGKMRAVGPDQLRHTELDLVLPATLAAETVTPATIASSYLINRSEKIAEANMTMWRHV